MTRPDQGGPCGVPLNLLPVVDRPDHGSTASTCRGGVRTWVVVLAVALWAGSGWLPMLAADSLRLETMVIRSARPENIVQHDVQVKGPLDSRPWEPSLEGPSHHSNAFVSDTRNEEARFNWYALGNTSEIPARTITVLAQIPDQAPVEFKLGKPMYFLSMAQQLADGKPSSAPKQLSHMVAYLVNGDTRLDPKAEVSVQLGSATMRVRLERPLLLCLPVEEWHHDEHSDVSDASFCLIIYETQPYGPSDPRTARTLDQFGLNSLQLQRAELVGVSASNVRLN